MRKKELLARIEKLEQELAEIRATAPFVYIPYVPRDTTAAPYIPWPNPYPATTILYTGGTQLRAMGEGPNGETFTAFNGGGYS
jgi:hypothetical protein